MDSQLKEQVLRRVRVVWYLREYSGIVFHVGLLLLVVWWSTVFVSYSQVFSNAPSDVTQFTSFIFSAWAHTEILNMLLFFLVLYFGGLLLRDLIRFFGTRFFPPAPLHLFR